MKLTSGKIQKPQRIVIHGPEGIGKSTLANQFPAPVFIDTEGSTNSMKDVKRMECRSWQDILDAVKWLKTQKHSFKTAVFDTADWAERFCVQFLCARDNKTSIEGWGYGKGYTFLSEEFGRLLASLDALIDSGMHIIFVAHTSVKKMELPDQEGSFDHYELKCSRQTSPLLKEWADALLFVNYKVIVTTDEDKRTKAVGGRKRIIHTQHTAAYDAKNRWELPDQIPFALPFDFGVFAKVLGENTSKPVVEVAAPAPVRPGVDKMLATGQATRVPLAPESKPKPKPDKVEPTKTAPEDVPPNLLKLMVADKIFAVELKAYCEEKSFIPKGGKLTEIPLKILGQMVLVSNWVKVVEKVRAARK